MTNLFIFMLVAYGASNIMVFSTIFSKWRTFFRVGAEDSGFFGKLFGCMMCLPFWWGVILSLLMFSPVLSSGGIDDTLIRGFTFPKEVLGAFFDGCLASGSVWFIHTVQERIEG